MLFDDPSSSSPTVGDARPAPPQRPTQLAPEPPAPDPRLIETAGAPEPEALRATTIASAVVRELYETGREVRFAFVPTRERVTVLLCDMDGVVLSRLTPARALEIATGEPIPGGRRDAEVTKRISVNAAGGSSLAGHETPSRRARRAVHARSGRPRLRG